MTADALPPASPAQPAWRRDLVLVLVATAVMMAINAASGFPSLADARGDNDSLLRLVEVRDLLAGQGWFDLHQYRMGPPGGFIMHWSRLVDAPIAAIVLAVSALTGSVSVAETAARILWPALLFAGTVYFLVRAARRFGGEIAVLPSVVIGAAALYFIGIYAPGALDHHNVQLMLATASLAFLLDAPSEKWAAALAGVCAALTLAVGMETAPYVAAAGLCVALLFTFGEADEGLIARHFGLGLAGACAAIFIGTVPASGWGEAQCDAFSVVQFVVAALGGVGLAAITALEPTRRNLSSRILSLGLLAFVVGAATVVFFPQCLASPYAGVDPRLRELWLDHVDEAQSLFRLIVADPASAIGRYVTPLVAMVLMALRFRAGGWRRQDTLVATLLVAAFLVSVWQVRGSTFSITFAVIPLSAWVGGWRERAGSHPSANVALRMIAVWVVSVNASWIGAAAAASVAMEGKAKTAQEDAAASPCQAASDFAQLGAMPDTSVLAVSNLGSPILIYSGHRVLAGPYHRNVAGDLIVLDAFMDPPEAARTIAMHEKIGLVALCRGDAETAMLAKKAPDGLIAALMRGAVPDWLEPIVDTAGKPLEIYRVRTGG